MVNSTTQEEEGFYILAEPLFRGADAIVLSRASRNPHLPGVDFSSLFYILASQQGCVDVLGKVFPDQEH